MELIFSRTTLSIPCVVTVSSATSCLTFFFFQAEDGIRDRDVTGVQTCALPISLPAVGGGCGAPRKMTRDVAQMKPRGRANRSEERRVGKEWRSRMWPYE